MFSFEHKSIILKEPLKKILILEDNNRSIEALDLVVFHHLPLAIWQSC